MQNILFGVTLFAYNAFTGFSGQYLYSDVYMTLFNVRVRAWGVRVRAKVRVSVGQQGLGFRV